MRIRTVGELIEKLQALPAKSEVRILYDGATRADVVSVYQAIGGYVVVAADDIAYSHEDQPVLTPKEMDQL